MLQFPSPALHKLCRLLGQIRRSPTVSAADSHSAEPPDPANFVDSSMSARRPPLSVPCDRASERKAG